MASDTAMRDGAMRLILANEHLRQWGVASIEPAQVLTTLELNPLRTTTQPRILHPSPFLLTLPTPPKPSRTMTQHAVQDTMSLISSALSSTPSPLVLTESAPSPLAPSAGVSEDLNLPASLFKPLPLLIAACVGVAGGDTLAPEKTAGRATPEGVTTRLRASTSISGLIRAGACGCRCGELCALEGEDFEDIMMSGSGNGTLSSETTFGWCGAGTMAATFTFTSPLLPFCTGGHTPVVGQP